MRGQRDMLRERGHRPRFVWLTPGVWERVRWSDAIQIVDPRTGEIRPLSKTPRAPARPTRLCGIDVRFADDPLRHPEFDHVADMAITEVP
jgi:hypothetical protein